MTHQSERDGGGQKQRSLATGSNRNFAIHKVVMLGEGGVGKSALVMQFVSHVFLDFHDPTIEDAYQSQIVVDNEACHLDILDTAGQEEFTAMREQYMRHGEGFILVYSITNHHSFERLRTHIQIMQKVRHFEKVPMVLIGNKLDMEPNRQVSRSNALALARELDCPFFETSAPYRQNVEEMFMELVREIRKKDKEAEIEVNVRKSGPLKKIRNIFGRLFKS